MRIDGKSVLLPEANARTWNVWLVSCRENLCDVYPMKGIGVVMHRCCVVMSELFTGSKYL
jgi:hypothetical protein